LKKLLKRLLILGLISIGIFCWLYYNDLIPWKYYYANDFGIDVIKSSNDYDDDGIDDYTDILEGAKIEADNHPVYKSSYYEGGYPPDGEGVCTDVIWRSFKNAGYNLKEMIDTHIRKNLKLYSSISTPDPNIDFRRVKNMMVYFKYNATTLTNDPYKIEEWMPGDIVIFSSKHIAIVSDRRNKEGIPFIIHNSGQPIRDEDAMISWYEKHGISGHFRLKD